MTDRGPSGARSLQRLQKPWITIGRGVLFNTLGFGTWAQLGECADNLYDTLCSGQIQGMLRKDMREGEIRSFGEKLRLSLGTLSTPIMQMRSMKSVNMWERTAPSVSTGTSSLLQHPRSGHN